MSGGLKEEAHSTGGNSPSETSGTCSTPPWATPHGCVWGPLKHCLSHAACHCGLPAPAGWRPDLVLQMPTEPTCACRALRLQPPSVSPLLADDNPSSSIKHHFLTGLSVASQAHLQHLVSSGRLTFSSAPLSSQTRSRLQTTFATHSGKRNFCLSCTDQVADVVATVEMKALRKVLL